MECSERGVTHRGPEVALAPPQIKMNLVVHFPQLFAILQ